MPMQAQDIVILIAFVCLGVYLVYRRVRYQGAWLSRDTVDQPSVGKVERRSELISFLESQGYEILHGPQRLPVSIQYGDKQLETLFAVDCLVRKDAYLYAVKKRRRSGRTALSGVSIRRELFPIALVYGTNGILYVDPAAGKIKEILFSYPDPPPTKSLRFWGSKVFWFVVGLMIGISIVMTNR
jgi:hypothetical protein